MEDKGLSAVIRDGEPSVNIPSWFDSRLREGGTGWLWAVFAVFGTFSVVYTGLLVKASVNGSSSLRHKYTGPLLVALEFTFAYFTYASNLGWTGIAVPANGSAEVWTPETGTNWRQVFYSKYIAWFLGFPIVHYLFEFNGVVAAASTASWSFGDLIHSFSLIVLGTEFFIVGLLAGSFVPTVYKWGYWAFSALAVLTSGGIAVNHHAKVLRTSALLHPPLYATHISSALYLVCWGLAEGTNILTPNQESIFYGILDMVVFGIIPAALTILSRINEGNLPSWSLFKRKMFDLEKGGGARSGETIESDHEPVE
ncbi:uncharacterized protein Ecym_1496 [Eremothecium cymbalariae DBVPG|uniref:Uncharacterized protein n=1 Tax=Eremothecium cymbalariae (strain CBS 270.75 / DBVPG 7215 / KCTC 17166 / NRRL Y-17582) TaxID=931890 RepID=G8JMK3_ERECY|nr:hypothetical protein Ecym_1496 [Eremothecium cymbalariae DBVPG\